MMKKLLKIFIYLLVFIFSIIAFLPKESFYNLLEKELEKQQVVISNEIRKEKLFDLDVLNANIYYQGLNIAKVDEVSFSTYLFYTQIDINNVQISENFTSFVPNLINNIKLKYSIFNFAKINIEGKGSFGEFIGEFDIFTKKIRIELNASSLMKNSYSKLLKNMKFENERYIYEYKL